MFRDASPARDVGRQGRRGQVADALSDPIVATTRTETALADWRAQIRLQFFAAALVIVVVIGMVFLIVRQLHQQHAAAQRKLSEKSQHLDTAINNMTQGLLLFDSSGRLVICNRRYIDMFALSTDVGQPGLHLRDLIRHRQDLGSFVCAVDAYCAGFSIPTAAWFRNTVTSTPDGPDPADLQALAGRRLGHDTGRRHRRAARPGRIEHLAHYDALPICRTVRCSSAMRKDCCWKPRGANSRSSISTSTSFKRINGHAGTSDRHEFLKGVAERLRQSVGPEDFIARLGGDEFAILQHGIASAEDVPRAGRAGLSGAAHTPFDCHGHQLSGDASIGIATAPPRRLGPVSIF